MFATTSENCWTPPRVAELRKPTDGTRWNNEQLLFHMLFGYLLVRNLRFLVWGFSPASSRLVLFWSAHES